MRSSFFTVALALLPLASAFPAFQADYKERIGRTMEMIKRDPELVELISTLYAQQKREAAEFDANIATHLETARAEAELERRTTGTSNSSSTSSGNCIKHPLPDYRPATVAGLKRFPEPGYEYKDPLPSDQRGVCPGLNALANHGYIPRSGIATLAQTIKGAAALFNMGADLTTFLAGGSVLLAGDIPTLTYSIGGSDKRTNSLGPLGVVLGTETGLSGHLRFKEGDASGTRCDFYLCNGDNHNLNTTIFLNLQKHARANGNQYNVPALTAHFKDNYLRSRNNNPYFYFLPQQAALGIGATYFIAGFFSNGTIGAGGVANEASIASFLGAGFKDDGSVFYQPEQVPPQGWYRRGTPMFLSEGIDGIFTLYAGAAAQLGDPLLFGANLGKPGAFTDPFGLAQAGGGTKQGFTCFLEQAFYGNFISEFGNLVNPPIALLNQILGLGFAACPVPTGAPAVMAAAPSYPGYPKPKPCTLNRMQNGVDQCAPDTNTYGGANTNKVPYCLNGPLADGSLNNPYPIPLITQ